MKNTCTVSTKCAAHTTARDRILKYVKSQLPFWQKCSKELENLFFIKTPLGLLTTLFKPHLSRTISSNCICINMIKL